MGLYQMRTAFGHYMKALLFVIAAIFIVGAVYQFGVAPNVGGGRKTGGEAVLATVGDAEITQQEFEVLWESAVENAKRSGTMSPLRFADVRAMLLLQLIEGKQVLQYASKLGIDVSEKAVRAEIDKFVVERLKENRKAILGEMSKEQEKLDPRKDKKYKKELSSVNTSVADQEERARQQIPEDQVRSQLAVKGIQEYVKKKVASVTEADVRNSYKSYKIRMIVLQKGNVPEEQLKTKVQKILQEGGAGADFAKLVAEHSQSPDKSQGGAAEYSFDAQFAFPPEMGDLLASMKPSAVRDLVTDNAIYIVKLDSVVDKTPEKLAEKDMKTRRDAIRQFREMQEGMKIQAEIAKVAKVEIKNPEMLGYWLLGEAQKSRTQAEAESKIKKAVDALQNAARLTPDNHFVQAKLAQVLAMTGKTKEAIAVLYPMLEGDNAVVEGADLRILLADLLLKNKETEKSIGQYIEASEVAINDPDTHTQLLAKFKELGRGDLVAKEEEWLKEYQIKKEAWEKLNQNAPASGGRPSGPEPSRSGE